MEGGLANEWINGADASFQERDTSYTKRFLSPKEDLLAGAGTIRVARNFGRFFSP